MDPGLSIYVLRLTTAVVDPIELDEYAGSALRGALFNALLRRFCMNPAALSCGECDLNPTCPVAGLIAPLRDERPRGRDVPRPFVLSYADARGEGLGAHGTQRGGPIGAGRSLTFELSLVGRAIAYLPYIALSIPLLESLGIGRPLRANGGRRGRFRVERIELVDPFGDEAQVLFRRGDSRVASPALAVTPARVARRAAALASDRLNLRFLTPTRLIAGGQLVSRPDLGVIVARLAERLDALGGEYGALHAESGPAEDGESGESIEGARARARLLVEHARAIRLVEDGTRWVDVASYSARQGRATPIGGLVGCATYEGDIAPLRELLVWGELIHVGKNAVKGDGHYRIEPETAVARGPAQGTES